MVVEVTKILGQRHHQVRRLAPCHGRLVGSGDNHHRTRQPRFSQVVLEELLDLAAALADQSDHVDIRLGKARQHGEQNRLANSGTGKDPNALAAAHREKGVERPDPEIQLAADPLARMCRRRRGAQRVGNAAGHQRPLSIHRLAHGTDDAAEPGLVRIDHRLADLELAFGAQTDPVQGRERHQKSATISKSDDLAMHPALIPSHQLATIADRKRALDAGHLDQHALNRRDPAINMHLGNPRQIGRETLHCQRQGVLLPSNFTLRVARSAGTLAKM